MSAPPFRRGEARFVARGDRPRFLARLFAPLLRGRVLDVGCDQAVLRAELGSCTYVGLDRTEAADVRQDLAREPRLPFTDASFDVVLCFDVLEHLDDPHGMFAELARVTREHLLVSLPNTWNAARKQLARGRGAIEHYGLPPEPPSDRHRWFFNLSEADAFLAAQGERHGLVRAARWVLEKPRPRAVRWARRLLQPDPVRYRDLYAHTLAVHFARPARMTDR